MSDEMITKPDANPIVAALLNWFLFGAAGYYILGQQKKAMVSAAIWFTLFILNFCTFGLTGLILLPYVLVVIYDAYLIGQKLQNGESVGVNENGLEFLNMIFK